MKIALKIVGIIGLLFWTACCFLGVYFATDGKLVIAIPVTLLIGVALFLSYLLMLKLQDRAVTQGNRDRAKTTGIIMLCVYIVATLCSAYYINHLVKTYENKESIQGIAASAIEELNVTFDTIGADNSYRDWVRAELRDYKRNVRLKVNNGTITTDTTLLWTKFNGSLLDNGYKNLETMVNATTAQVNASVVEAWYLPTLLTRLKELERKKAWEDEAIEYSKGHEYTQDDPFTPVSRIDCANLSNPLTQDNFKVSIPAILIMIALQVIILLAYLLGLKTGGKNDKIVTDDHGSTRSWSSTK